MDGIEVSGAQTLFQIGPIAVTQTILSMIVVTAILAITGVLLGRNLQKRPGKLQVLTPASMKRKNMSIQAIFTLLKN